MLCFRWLTLSKHWLTYWRILYSSLKDCIMLKIFFNLCDFIDVDYSGFPAISDVGSDEFIFLLWNRGLVLKIVKKFYGQFRRDCWVFLDLWVFLELPNNSSKIPIESAKASLCGHPTVPNKSASEWRKKHKYVKVKKYAFNSQT